MSVPDRRDGAGRLDRLDRFPLAAKVAALIGGFRGRESLVIGIEGPWGAGKTSFTGLVLKEVAARGNTVIVPFNPWNLSQQNELVAEFFSSLTGALARKAGKTPDDKPPTYGSRLRETARRSLAAAGWRQILRGKNRTPEEERVDLYERLGNLQDRILIVTDDIDRLDAEQTRLFMKLVRIASNLPNLVFLLAYDRQRVAGSVEEDGRPGDDYLKTIVQVVFTLPEPSRQELNSVLFGQLHETIARVYGDSRVAEDDERWHELVYAGLPALFRTTADVSGFVSSLRISWSMVGGDEVNMVDFIGIEAIRVFAPRLYAAIGTNRSLFAGTEAVRLSDRDDAAERQARYEDVLRTAPEDVRPTLDRICRQLFPHLGAQGYGDNWQDEWRGQKRVCAEDRFGVYFQLGVLEPTVSETEVLFLRRRLDSSDAITEILRQYLSDGRLGVLLSKLLTQSVLISESDARSLLLGLWAMEKEIDERHGSGFDPNDTPSLAVQLARNLMRDAVKEQQRALFLDELVRETAATAYPLALVSALEQQVGKSGHDAEKPLLTLAELEAPKARLQERAAT